MHTNPTTHDKINFTVLLHHWNSCNLIVWGQEGLSQSTNQEFSMHAFIGHHLHISWILTSSLFHSKCVQSDVCACGGNDSAGDINAFDSAVLRDVIASVYQYIKRTRKLTHFDCPTANQSVIKRGEWSLTVWRASKHDSHRELITALRPLILVRHRAFFTCSVQKFRLRFDTRQTVRWNNHTQV